MYRNDHDAALARIDALEGEVRRLEGALARRDAPSAPPRFEEPEPIERAPRTSFGGWLATFFVVGMLIISIAASAAQHRHRHHSYTPRPVPQFSQDALDRVIRRAAPTAAGGRSICTEMTTTQQSPGSMPLKTTSSRLAPSGIGL